ncbi:hypothetical protein Tco_0579107, partial [Tanacetum coccineum]
MASFPCLEGLAVAANSRSLFDRMMLYFERETSIDFDFAADLQNLWVQFIDRTNDRKLFISELDGLPPSVMSYNCCQFLQQVQENDFIKLLELRKMIAETYHKMAEENIPALTRFDDPLVPNTNLFRAFTASANVPSIYIHQFWNTLTQEAKSGVYSFQLDEQWFPLNVDLLRKALEITPIDPDHPFVSPYAGEQVMDFVNELGYQE